MWLAAVTGGGAALATALGLSGGGAEDGAAGGNITQAGSGLPAAPSSTVLSSSGSASYLIGSKTSYSRASMSCHGQWFA